MDVFQCPECALRFRSTSEMDQHLAIDHPDFHAEPKSAEDAEIAAARRRRRDVGGKVKRRDNSPG